MSDKMTVSFPYSRLTPEQVKAFTKRVGRPPTPGEELMGQLARKQTPQMGQPWRVRPAGQEEDPFDRDERIAMEQVEQERVARMSPAERTLFAVQKARAKRDADLKAQSDHAAKLELFKPQLDQLDKLIENAAFDPDYSYEDVEMLFNAKKQIEFEGACPMYGEQMFAVCLATAREKFASRLEQARSARDQAAMEQARLDQNLANFSGLTGIGELVKGEEVDAAEARMKKAADEKVLKEWQIRWDGLTLDDAKKRAAYQALLKSESSQEERDAAFNESHAALKARQAHWNNHPDKRFEQSATEAAL